LRLRLVVACYQHHLPIYHVEIAVLQHAVAPAYREQLWTTSWLATCDMNSQAEQLKEAFYAPDILAYNALSPLDAVLKCMAG
jgi:hypothetical protein